MTVGFFQAVKNCFLFIFALVYLILSVIYFFPGKWNNLTSSGKTMTACTITGVLLICVMINMNFGKGNPEIGNEETISTWLTENNYQKFTNIFSLTGKENEALSRLDEEFAKSLYTLPDVLKEKLQKDIGIAKEKKHLNLWLSQIYSIPHTTIMRLNFMGIRSMAAFRSLKEEDVQKWVGDQEVFVYLNLQKAIKDTETADVNFDVLEHNEKPGLSLWVKLIIMVFTIIFGGIIIIFIMVADCLGRALNRIPSGSSLGRRHQIRPSYPSIPSIPSIPPANNNKGWFWNWLVGSYASSSNCCVTWGWEEPQTVGSTVSFVVLVKQKNGKPYKLNDSRIVHVEILHKGEKVSCTKQLEKEGGNCINIAFTVHKSGPYKVHVLVNGKHIAGSPFVKVFEAGCVDASKTGFQNYCSTIVCPVGQSYPLVIETRDCYDNPATYKTDHHNYFKIKVTETETNEKYTPTSQIIHNVDSGQLTMHIKMEEEGCYQAVVSYGDTKLKNGDFNILVISEEDLEIVNKTTAKKSHNLWYEARLITDTADSEEKSKKVYIYISPKQLTIKEYFLKIIGKKLHTFRVAPSTKFSFIGYNTRYDAPVMKVYGGSQVPVMLATKDRNIIAATFTNFLLRNIGGSETLQDKQLFFFNEVKKLAKRGNVTLKIDRANLLYSSYKAAKSLYASDWFKTFNIEFVNELGLDWGGLRREWVQVLCTELFDPEKSGLFTRFTDHTQGLVHPCHLAGSKIKYYELAGKIVGKCLLDSSAGNSSRLLIKANFSRSFLAQIIGLQINYKYFETDDPELYKTKIKFIEDNSIDGMDLTFSEDEYCDGQLLKTVDLIPNGSKIEVTNDNKIQYLNCLAQYKLVSCVKEEVEAFLKGLNYIIPDNLLSIFDENELELLMCGTDNYSFSDFKDHAEISGDFIGSKLLEWFWAIVASFTDEQMARLLQFTTGSSQLPPGGFKDLDPKFTISFTSYSSDSLPTAHTCFNQLCLPAYTSMEHMHHCILTAINEGFQGFGFA